MDHEQRVELIIEGDDAQAMMDDRGALGMIHEWTDCGAAILLFAEEGPHLPGIDMKSTVYLIEKN